MTARSSAASDVAVAGGARSAAVGATAAAGAPIRRESTLTCPHCGHAHRQAMPVDACQWFWECPGCHAILRPRPGDCCVFCSYGDVPCPSVQRRQRVVWQATR